MRISGTMCLSVEKCKYLIGSLEILIYLLKTFWSSGRSFWHALCINSTVAPLTLIFDLPLLLTLHLLFWVLFWQPSINVKPYCSLICKDVPSFWVTVCKSTSNSNDACSWLANANNHLTLIGSELTTDIRCIYKDSTTVIMSHVYLIHKLPLWVWLHV